jgi:hypothetical protein
VSPHFDHAFFIVLDLSHEKPNLIAFKEAPVCDQNLVSRLQDHVDLRLSRRIRSTGLDRFGDFTVATISAKHGLSGRQSGAGLASNDGIWTGSVFYHSG